MFLCLETKDTTFTTHNPAILQVKHLYFTQTSSVKG